MRLGDLLSGVEIIYTDISEDDEILKITTETKNCGKNCLLILPNRKTFTEYEQLRHINGYVMCESDMELPKGLKAVRVGDIRRAYAFVCSNFFVSDYSRVKIIGVSGTNGKTTTSTLIKAGLECEGNKVGIIGTGKIEIGTQILNERDYSMTTPDPIILYKAVADMIDYGCNYIVMEVSSHSLELKKVAPIRFEYAVFTNLSSEHMDFHKNMENYYQAKKILFEQATHAIINIDDAYGRRLIREIKCRYTSVGILWRGSVWASNIQSIPFCGSSFLYHGNNFCCKINSKLPGIYNVYNCIEAIAVCTATGIKPCSVKRALENVSTIKGRYEIINGKIKAIIDYAHTPNALENLLKDIKLSKSNSQKLTVVFGCGGERDREKRPVMASVAEKYADRVFVTSDNSRKENPLNIIDDIIRGFNRNGYKIIPDRKKAINYAIMSAQDGDIVAIVGKGHEGYNIDASGYHAFDEGKIVRDAMAERNEN